MKTLVLVTLAAFMFAACSKDNGGGGEPDDNNPTTQHALGWNKSSDDLSKYPKEISFQFTSSGSSANLPSSVDLTGKLPPVGNQGNYGTCVAWSVAYGLRTYLDAASRNLSAQQLADPSNQYSPADLWMAMATADKAADCGGSNFEPALNLLVNRGVATLKTAPYSSLQCGGTPQQAWTADAANRKILNYRMIAEADMTVENLKTHLAQGQAMSFGARLGDNFMAWNGTGVLSSETYNQPNMQHAYHALVLAGYDDSKGANGAFLVYNSWGTDWGNAGKIWVDYKFFLENFVFAAFVATPDNNVNPNDDNRIDPNDLSSGTDLAAYHAYDVGGNFGGGYNRQLYFNIYNAGSTPVASSRRYSIVYIYYNAFDANDYGVLTDLYITDQIPRNTIQQSQRPVEGYCSFDVNMDIPAGTSIASAFFGNNYEYTYMTYYMPNTLNGYYYFVLMADPYNNVSETNEQNNLFFIADPNGYPYYVMNGMPQTRAGETHAAAALPPFGRTTRNAELAPTHSLVPQNRNAYTPDEIRALIRDRKASGELDKRIREFDATRKAPEIGGK